MPMPPMERAPSIYQELKFLQKGQNFEIRPFYHVTADLQLVITNLYIIVYFTVFTYRCLYM